jgi:hypothetical protein
VTPTATDIVTPIATNTPTPTATLEPPTLTPTATPTPVPPTVTPLPPDPVFVGAGDIADCDPDGAALTANLLDTIKGTVFTVGDNAYGDGTADQYNRCYNPTWGRHKARTRPAPGNHDYHTSNAAPYYAYFGDNAGPAGRGYYSFNLGAWHIISLNSEVAAGATSAQAQWLREDLAANPAACTLAYWHKPLFSSGQHGNNSTMRLIWDILAGAGADVILTGHDHLYERFAPQNSAGQAYAKGMREFVVGTGGASHYQFSTIRPNSEVRNNDTFGVLKLTLRPTRYEWEFVPVAGGSFHDSGGADCVSALSASDLPLAVPASVDGVPDIQPPSDVEEQDGDEAGATGEWRSVALAGSYVCELPASAAASLGRRGATAAKRALDRPA